MLVLGERGRQVRFVLRDHDAKFCRGFDDVFCSEGVEVLVTPPVRVPKANAYAERWVHTVRAECLDWLLIVCRSHLEQHPPSPPGARAAATRPVRPVDRPRPG
jgi:putative transposase